MFRRPLVFLLSIFVLGAASMTASTPKAPSWVIWLEGNHYLPDWSVAMEAILQVMKPGDSALIRLPGHHYRLIRQPGSGQHKELMGAIRADLEQGAHRITQLAQEMTRLSSQITAGQELNSIKAYLFSRKQLLDLYAEPQRGFWSDLEGDLVPEGARLVVLIQQFDVPAVAGQTLRVMMEGRLRDWVGDLQQATPWEEKDEVILRVAEGLRLKKVRTDCLYLKRNDRTAEVGAEISKAFFRGISRLCRLNGGSSRNLNSNLDLIVSGLLEPTTSK